MKIVCLLGSPRVKGNSSTIAKHFCSTAENRGAEVKTFALNELKYRGCQGCMKCKTKADRCVLKDDLAEVLDAIREADILLMASPVYYGDISSQLKAFIDRTFSYLTPDYTSNPNPSRLMPGKKLVFILVQGNPDINRFSDIFPRYDFFFQWYGFVDNRLIQACGIRDPGEIDAHKDILALAEKMAGELCS